MNIFLFLAIGFCAFNGNVCDKSDTNCTVKYPGSSLQFAKLLNGSSPTDNSNQSYINGQCINCGNNRCKEYCYKNRTADSEILNFIRNLAYKYRSEPKIQIVEIPRSVVTIADNTEYQSISKTSTMEPSTVYKTAIKTVIVEDADCGEECELKKIKQKKRILKDIKFDSSDSNSRRKSKSYKKKNFYNYEESDCASDCEVPHGMISKKHRSKVNSTEDKEESCETSCRLDKKPFLLKKEKDKITKNSLVASDITVTRLLEKTKTVEKPLTLFREMTTTMTVEKPVINYKVTTFTESITKTEKLTVTVNQDNFYKSTEMKQIKSSFRPDIKTTEDVDKEPIQTVTTTRKPKIPVKTVFVDSETRGVEDKPTTSSANNLVEKTITVEKPVNMSTKIVTIVNESPTESIKTVTITNIPKTEQISTVTVVNTVKTAQVKTVTEMKTSDESQFKTITVTSTPTTEQTRTVTITNVVPVKSEPQIPNEVVKTVTVTEPKIVQGSPKSLNVNSNICDPSTIPCNNSLDPVVLTKTVFTKESKIDQDNSEKNATCDQNPSPKDCKLTSVPASKIKQKIKCIKNSACVIYPRKKHFRKANEGLTEAVTKAIPKGCSYVKKEGSSKPTTVCRFVNARGKKMIKKKKPAKKVSYIDEESLMSSADTTSDDYTGTITRTVYE